MSLKPLPKEVVAWLETQSHGGARVFREVQMSHAYKDKPAMIPAPDEKGLIFDLMMKPTPFLKFGRSGAPHWRNLYLSSDRKRIVWTSRKRGGESQILISEIKYVENSQRSKVNSECMNRKGRFYEPRQLSLKKDPLDLLSSCRPPPTGFRAAEEPGQGPHERFAVGLLHAVGQGHADDPGRGGEAS